MAGKDAPAHLVMKLTRIGCQMVYRARTFINRTASDGVTMAKAIDRHTIGCRNVTEGVRKQDRADQAEKPVKRWRWKAWLWKGSLLFFLIKGMLWLLAAFLAWQSMP